MSHVIARLKNKSVQLCKVISTDDDIISLPNLSDTVNFDPHYKPEKGQWLTISGFSNSVYAISALATDINTADFLQLDNKAAVNIKFLCIIQGQYRFYQRIAPSQIIGKKLLKLSDFSILESEKMIIINDIPDAFHDTATDKLYFTDFSVLKTFFSKIEDLYREATDDEVKTFLQNEVIKAAPDFTSEKVSKPNRQRIALAQQKLTFYTKQNLEQLLQEFPEYIQDVEITDGSFTVKTDNDLKMAIFCIEERFYTTSISKEKRLANSILKLGAVA